MKKEIPVFFVHIGAAEYLKKTIQQAKKYNKNVFLIGDQSNREFCDNWYNIYDNYGHDYEKLKSDYKHMSTNIQTFEFSAIAKFLAVYTVAVKNNCDSLMLLDSDLMTYVNYSEIDWEGADAGFSIPEIQEPYIWTVSVHCSYWTLKALKNFIDYLLCAYTEHIKVLEEKWRYDINHKRQGGICDMTLVYLWYKEHPEMQFYNTAKIHNKMVFDHFLAVSEGYKTGDFKINHYLKMKQLKFEDGIPYFRYRDNTWIRTCTVHAQGARKNYIDALYECAKYPMTYYKIKMTRDFIRVWNKAKRFLNLNK